MTDKGGTIGGMETSQDWARVEIAAEQIGKSRRQVYAYLQKPPGETGIRTRKIGRTQFVHIPSLADYEATVKTGRPRKT